MTEHNLPVPDDAPWLNLSPEEIEDLRNNKKQLTDEGMRKIRELMREWFREEVEYLIRKEVFPEKHSMNDDPSYWADKAFGDVVSAFCKEDN